mgnify:FL=1
MVYNMGMRNVVQQNEECTFGKVECWGQVATHTTSSHLGTWAKLIKGQREVNVPKGGEGRHFKRETLISLVKGLLGDNKSRGGRRSTVTKDAAVKTRGSPHDTLLSPLLSSS